MKLKIGLAWIALLVLVSVAHVRLNIGWERFLGDLRESLGLQRRTLYVGFLPVT